MKTLYLECSLGVSGDMLLAALSDLVPEGERVLAEAVAGLGLPGVSLRFSEQMVQGIRTRRVEVLEESPQPLRHLRDLTDLIAAAALPERVKELALAALTRLAEAESRVHGEPLDTIHFHEVGAVDTVVDALGAVLLAHATGAGRVVASPVNLGSGFVTFSHGRFPVPAPACAELARGMRTFATDSGMELATPTGLAVVKTLAEGYGPLPLGSVEGVGYGSGTYSTGAYPTFLRAFLVETQQARGRGAEAGHGNHHGHCHGQGHHHHEPGHSHGRGLGLGRGRHHGHDHNHRHGENDGGHMHHGHGHDHDGDHDHD